MKAARDRKAGRAEIARVRDDYRFDIELERDSELEAETTYLLRKAYRYRVEVPGADQDDYWTSSNTIDGRILSPKGIKLVRSAVREERKEATELLRSWLPTAISAFAALGAWIAALRH